MKNSLLITLREWKARAGSRSFIVMSILGPIAILAITYALFTFGEQGKKEWNVLVTDPFNLMGSRIVPDDRGSITYSFADDYIELEDFRDQAEFQEFDAMIEINEKILSIKSGHVFYREPPTPELQIKLIHQVERRIEEVLVENLADFTLEEYLKIKQALGLKFTDVYDPHNEASNMTGWLGLCYGSIIFIFIFLFGMTILRSVSREKSNRIVEVLLASVSPGQLMTGKIVGIGLAAIVQFLIWVAIIGLGLYFMRETLFPDFYNAANLVDPQSLASAEYNQFVDLIYVKVPFSRMIPFFVVFFIVGYLFYGSLFAAIGATMGSESDGQQFVLPLIFLLCFSLYSGYYVMNYPESNLAMWLQYIPFTAPVVVMVKLAQGYEPGHGYEIYLSLFILIVSSFVFLRIAARLYKNGILQFGHRLQLKHMLKWLRKG
jgi:ABC-2 type transport system permease protein